MRKIIFVIVMCISTVNSINAQTPAEYHYKKFRVDITGGADINPGRILDSIEAYGSFLSIEPRYNFTDNLGISLRFLYGEVYNNFKEEVAKRRNKTVLVNFICISNVTGTDSRWDLDVRWFAGVGVGITTFRNIVDTIFFPLAPETKAEYKGTGFAFMPRLGLELGRLTSAFYYYYTINKGANYFGVSIGFYLGGGKLEK